MSADPVWDLQAVLMPRLRADPALNALIGGRIYDAVEPTAQFPYVSLGPAQVTTQDTDDCMIVYEIVLQFDVWAQGSKNGSTYEAAGPQMARIAGTLRQALHAAELDELTLESHRLHQIRHEDTLYLRDPDGLTAHGAVRFQALVDQM